MDRPGPILCQLEGCEVELVGKQERWCSDLHRQTGYKRSPQGRTTAALYNQTPRRRASHARYDASWKRELVSARHEATAKRVLSRVRADANRRELG